MASYYLPELQQLALQLRLSPRHLCIRHAQGIERLICEVLDPAGAYPYDLVCYHITGYRPKRGEEPEGSLPAQELIHDLVLLAEEMTTANPVPAEQVPGTVRDAARLAEYLHVSTKTIHRWRWRGLLGLKLAGPDGTTKLMFSERAVRAFVDRYPDLVRRAASFTNLSAQEKDTVLTRARELAKVRRTTLHEVAKRVAVETGRAVETVRYTIRRHDRHHPDAPIFDVDGRPIVNAEHHRLYCEFRRGVPIDKLATDAELRVADVEGIVREMRARELQDDPPECVYTSEFDSPGADALILKRGEHPCGEVEEANVSGDGLLSREQEYDLFRQYNYLKFKARCRIDALEPTQVGASALHAIEQLLDEAGRIRNRIAQANLRLVTSIAKRHVGPRSTDLPEVISDGNLSLLRAIETFDVSRGNKFSTYASWAIIRNYARTIPQEWYLTARFATGNEEMLAHLSDQHPEIRPEHRLLSPGEVVRHVLDHLTARERAVVTQRFGLAHDRGPHTLEQLGRALGVTKERIRQIERAALTKLRAALAPHYDDLFD